VVFKEGRSERKIQGGRMKGGKKKLTEGGARPGVKKSGRERPVQSSRSSSKVKTAGLQKSGN